ncbi:MAG: LuxR family transcriptional regulator [Rhizobiales bacterium]|nr:LuxR family transcriptional regulator [Hyphomicrobiales bacterium]
MIARYFPIIKRERRAVVLSTIILLQALCAIFFIGDVIYDLSQGDHLDDLHLILEGLAALALIAGVIYLMHELRDLLDRMASMEFGLRVARGEMIILIESFFDHWQLTPSEREIALLILKGIDNDSIAKMRGTAQGTVRAQCTQIYAKAKVDGRTQLLSIFMEELLHVGEEQ